MILVIDAYNVLKQALHSGHVSDSSRTLFIKQLGKYGKKKGHAIICVFDGGSYEWTDKERIDGVLVVHSGIHESADEWIKHYLDHHKAYDVLLISTDRELNRYGARLGVQSLDAIDFYGILQDSLNERALNKSFDAKAIKTSQQDQPCIDELMEQASKKMVIKIEDVMRQERESKAHKLSKKERHIMQKLKKL
jgi:predicted RNA-binding protein with PIN domain